MTISFQGKLTQRELVRVFSLALKRMRWLVFVCGPLCLIGIALTAISHESASSYFFLIAAIIFAILGAYPFWGPLVFAPSTYKRQADFRETIEGTISEDEVYLHTINSTQNAKWAVYHKVVRDQEAVLLFLKAHRRLFQVFPRSFFSSDEDWQKFQALLDEKIKSGELKK